MSDTPAARRILVVEDEYLIRMLLEDMLVEIGYEVAASVGSLAEAKAAVEAGGFDGAILDVNLDGEEIYPIAEILAARALPFVFVTGYGESSLADPFGNRPALQKPFQTEQLQKALAELLAPA
jgi:CheY-like chemotaxis protein